MNKIKYIFPEYSNEKPIWKYHNFEELLFYYDIPGAFTNEEKQAKLFSSQVTKYKFQASIFIAW